MLLFLTEPTTESKETSRITRDPFHIGTKYCQKQVNIQHSRLLKASKKSGLLFHKIYFFAFFFCISIAYIIIFHSLYPF